MRTLRADRHIGSVEWVTLQVLVSHSVDGAWKVVAVVVAGVSDLCSMYFDGVRSVIVVGAELLDAAGGAAPGAVSVDAMMLEFSLMDQPAWVCEVGQQRSRFGEYRRADPLLLNTLCKNQV